MSNIDNFEFDADITPDQKAKLLERHRHAYGKIDGCALLKPEEKKKLKEAYDRTICHHVSTKAGVNASARLNGSDIWVNFGVLFPQGDREIAQTLIHEMMHCAGYSHPKRKPTDQPFDNGEYYGTPPLQSEICIAGLQSDLEVFAASPTLEPSDLLTDCIPEEDGTFHTSLKGAQ